MMATSLSVSWKLFSEVGYVWRTNKEAKPGRWYSSSNQTDSCDYTIYYNTNLDYNNV